MGSAVCACLVESVYINALAAFLSQANTIKVTFINYRNYLQ